MDRFDTEDRGVKFNSRRDQRVLTRERDQDDYGFGSLDFTGIAAFLDIGANVGTVSLAVREREPRISIVAVEPHPVTFRRLVENCKGSGIVCDHCALGTGPVALEPGRSSLSHCYFPPNGESNPLTHILVKTLPELVLHHALPVEGLALKVDIEGAECCMVSDSASEAILAKVPILAMELHDETPDLIRWLVKLAGPRSTVRIRFGRHPERLANLLIVRQR